MMRGCVTRAQILFQGSLAGEKVGAGVQGKLSSVYPQRTKVQKNLEKLSKLVITKVIFKDSLAWGESGK